ncbi:MAG: hypothetical protein V8T31_00165 [Lachnospiraceae bacterium]
MDSGTSQLVRELLEKYAVIEISGDQGTIYQGPVLQSERHWQYHEEGLDILEHFRQGGRKN